MLALQSGPQSPHLLNGGLESEALLCWPGGAGCQATPTLRPQAASSCRDPDAYAAVRGSVASSSTTPGTATRQVCPSLMSPRVCPSSRPVSLSAEGPTKLLLWEPPGLGHSSPPRRSGPPSRGREPRGPGPRLLPGLEGRSPQAEAEAQGPPHRHGDSCDKKPECSHDSVSPQRCPSPQGRAERQGTAPC